MIKKENLKKVKIALIGDLIEDHYIYGTIKRSNPEAPAPLVTVEHESRMVGGAHNVLRCLFKLGVDVDFYTMDNSPPIKTRIIVDGKQILRFDNEDGMRDINRIESDYILSKVQKGYDAIIISDYAKGTVGPWIADLPNGVFIDAHPNNYHFYVPNTNLKMNHKELKEITGFDDVLTGIDIIKKDHRTVVITQGEKGAVYLDNCKPVSSVSAHKRAVSDVTGAGDAFMAAYVSAYVATGNMADSIEFANLYAGISVEKVGSYHPTWEEVNNGRAD